MAEEKLRRTTQIYICTHVKLSLFGDTIVMQLSAHKSGSHSKKRAKWLWQEVDREKKPRTMHTLDRTGTRVY